VELGLAGRIALVTGSWRGTGSAIAATLASEGATVLVHGFEPGQAEPVAERIREAGGEAHAVSGDIASEEGCNALAKQALAEFGHIDVLVNNYGVAEGGSWSATESDEWVSIYQKNVLSGVRLVQHFSPGMRGLQGRPADALREPGQRAGGHRHHGEPDQPRHHRDRRGTRRAAPPRRQEGLGRR
jgi:NAD(P)-dependent dehydrogenase (short-subunit alcohol dehydrogenase family)